MKTLIQKTNRNCIVKNILFTCSIALLINGVVFAQGTKMSIEEVSEVEKNSLSPVIEASSTDVIIFTNGKQVSADVISIDSTIITYRSNRHRNPVKQCNLEDVFSVAYKNNTEQIIYSQDTTSDQNYLSVEEMRSYILGAQDARKNFRSPVSSITGVFTGAASAMAGFWTVPILFIHPYICASITSDKKSKPFDNIVPNTEVANPLTTAQPDVLYGKMFVSKKSGSAVTNAFKYNQKSILQNCYNNGYRDAASEKKALNAVKGNVIGFVGIILLSALLVL